VPLSCWEELGISPTADRALIRRAYAGRLKALSAEHDPAAFQRLRTAYESALSASEGQPQRPPEAIRKTTPGDSRDCDPAAERARAAIAAALARGASAEAFAAFDTAIDRGWLALADVDEFEEQLLVAAAPDRALSTEQLLGMVRRFMWDSPLHPLRRRRPQALTTLDARLDAERWYRELVERANQPRGFYESDARLAARQILKGPPNWRERSLFPNRSPALWRELTGLNRHHDWVGGRFDAARVTWCRGRSANRQGQRAALTIWGLLLLFSVMLNAGRQGMLILLVSLALFALTIGLRRRKKGARQR